MIKIPVTEIARKIRSWEPFSMARFGDGEWNAILEIPKLANCDGQPYEAVREDLKRVLLARPAYTLGMQPLAVKIYGAKIEAWLSTRGLSGLNWIDGGVLHFASYDGNLEPFISAFEGRWVLLVGPEYLRKLTVIQVSEFVPVLDQGRAHENRDEVLEMALSTIGTRKDPVVLVSAGMTAKGLIHDMYSAVGSHATIIDCGSLWDPYVGKRTRSYHDAVLRRLAGEPS